MDLTLEPGDVVAEVRAGCVDSMVCGCGSVETFFTSVESAPVCEWTLRRRAMPADPQKELRLRPSKGAVLVPRVLE